MPGIGDKLKDTFEKAKDKFDEVMDSEQVDKAKATTKELAGKATATAKTTYEKVSDKAKDVIGNGDQAAVTGGEESPEGEAAVAEASADDGTA